MEDGFGDEDGGRRRETGRRTVPETWMENGDVYVVVGAHRVKPCITTT